MAKAKKSDDYFIDLPPAISKRQMQAVIEAAAEASGMYVSHIGRYSRVKYPNSVHWHFKRDRAEAGVLDATFWDVKNVFWLMVRHSEPQWVQQIVPRFLRAVRSELASI